MSIKSSKQLINLVNINFGSLSKSNNKFNGYQTSDEKFQSFAELCSVSATPNERKSDTLWESFLDHNESEIKKKRKSTKYSISIPNLQNSSVSQNISKIKNEEFSLKSKNKNEKQKKMAEKSEPNEKFLYLSKFDLTNKLLDILKENSLAIPIWGILSCIDFLFRVNTMTYFFYKLFWVSQYYHIYLIFICFCRVVYILMMIKLLFQSEFEDVYLQRISNNFNISGEGSKLIFWSKTIEYDFEFNLDPYKKKISDKFKKKSKKFEWIKTIKFLAIRLLLTFFPNELCLLIAKPLYGENEFSILISVLCAWLYKSVEIYTIIPFLALFYFYEDWNIGFNYDFISLILLSCDVCKSLSTMIILFILNKQRTRSQTLFSLSGS